jgi:hypothetical protein
MGGGEDGTKQDAEATHDNVGDAEEGVPATHDGAGGDQDRFGPTVLLDTES